MHKTGDLWDGTFLLIESLTGWIEDGSCKADIIAGWIYFIFLFYEVFFFFLPVSWPISTSFKSHIIICPFIVPAITIVGSFGLNSKVKT